MRLQKYLADAGAASRRRAEEMISQGRVKVNGTAITSMGHIVDENADTVELDGKAVSIMDRKIYIMLNKPRGVITSCRDERGRKTVLDLIDIKDARLFPAGRLDFDTEGLLILTNDGELANILTHPKNRVAKTYLVHTREKLTVEDMKKLTSGVEIDDRATAKALLKRAGAAPQGYAYEIGIHEGRNRQIRIMFDAVGKKAVYLKRISIGKLSLGDMQAGQWRKLSPEEVRYLYSLKDER